MYFSDGYTLINILKHVRLNHSSFSDGVSKKGLICQILLSV